MNHSEHKCVHFCSEWSIVGYGTGALWDLGISWIAPIIHCCFTGNRTFACLPCYQIRDPEGNRWIGRFQNTTTQQRANGIHNCWDVINNRQLMFQMLMTLHNTTIIPVRCRSLALSHRCVMFIFQDDVIKWKHFPRYWPFMREFHRSPVNSPHKGQWRGALMFSFICARPNGRVNNREAGDLSRHRAHYEVTVMGPRRNVFDAITLAHAELSSVRTAWNDN